ncbi:hypothetical protein ACROYT_G034928 [Oculina patagonica]
MVIISALDSGSSNPGSSPGSVTAVYSPGRHFALSVNFSTQVCNMDFNDADASVPDPYEPVGCFADQRKPRALPKRFKSSLKVNWTDMSNSFAAIIHACATKVYENGFWYFGVEYYKECWSGVNGSLTYNRHGSAKCFMNYSVGAQWTIFVYRFVEVNGSWSLWLPWQPCSVTCGGGKRTRTRTCNNPPPKWNGDDCPGMNVTTESCNLDGCKVNGSWSYWLPWQPCSVTCGGGKRTRVRTCTKPPPKWNGEDCPGTNVVKESCNLHTCRGDNYLHHKNATYLGLSTGNSSFPLVAKILGGSLLALLCFSGALWLALRHLRKSRSNSELSDPFEILFDDISLHKIIGEGAFGKVYSGELLKRIMVVGKGIQSLKRKKEKEKHQRKKGLRVAAKMLRNGATEEQKQEFLEEIELMKQIGYHRNILNLMACCTITTPMFLVVEFAKYGDLLQYLRKRREQVAGDTISRCTVTGHRSFRDDTGRERNVLTDTDKLHDDDTLRTADLSTFAWQIAKGMEFLSRKGFVHRDLAARNVLVCEGKLVKIADFGLSRYVYTTNVYHATKARKLPIKWMSPEAIHDQIFTVESDVWAYGILLWEISTIGGTPYPTISNQRLLRVLKAGYRMEKPQICSDEMYEVMQQCWKEKPAERPSFTIIREQLERMMLRHCPYLDIADANYTYAPCCDSEPDEETEHENTAL